MKHVRQFAYALLLPGIVLSLTSSIHAQDRPTPVRRAEVARRFQAAQANMRAGRFDVAVEHFLDEE